KADRSSARPPQVRQYVDGRSIDGGGQTLLAEVAKTPRPDPHLTDAVDADLCEILLEYHSLLAEQIIGQLIQPGLQLPFIVQYALPPTGPTLHQFGPQRPGWQKQSAGAQGVTPVEGTVAGQYCPRGTCNELA